MADLPDWAQGSWQGPIPDNISQVPTVFGQINAVLQQATTTANQIRRTVDAYSGRTIPQPLPQRSTTNTEIIGIVVVLGIAGLLAWLIIRGL